MKKRLTNDLGLKILSIMLAFFIWLLVVNVSNPEVTRSQDVLLEFVNGSVLEDAGRTYEVSRRTVSVTYDIHTLDEYRMSASDFRAYVDLSDLYDVTGSVEVKVETLNNGNLIRNVAARPTVVRVQTEELQQKEFELTAKLMGEVADGYSMNEVYLEPSSITVEGPMSQVGLINSVGVEIVLTGAESDLSGSVSPVFYDANGSRMSFDDRITTNIEQIEYSVSVSRTRRVPILFEVTGTPSNGYRYIGYRCPVSSVSVNGRESVLLSLAQIVISDAALNVEGASEDRVVSIDLRQHMPEGVELEEQVDPIVDVTLMIEELSIKTIYLSESDIMLVGIDDELNYRISPTRIAVTLRGFGDELEGIGAIDLEPSMDVSGMAQGTHTGHLMFATNEDYSVEEVVDITVDVSERPSGQDDLTHEQPGWESDGPGGSEAVEANVDPSHSSHTSEESAQAPDASESVSQGQESSRQPEESLDQMPTESSFQNQPSSESGVQESPSASPEQSGAEGLEREKPTLQTEDPVEAQSAQAGETDTEGDG